MKHGIKSFLLSWMNPKISVIIPFFNAAKTLQRAIESVLTQEEDFELILVNDGSLDDSESVAKTFLLDTRVSYLCQENRGVSAARNLGAAHAKGEWLIFLDGDDLFEPNSFFIIANYLRLEFKNSFFQFGVKRIKKEGSISQSPMEGKYFPRLSGSFILKKAVFDKVGGYDSNLKFSENTELFHRVSTAGFLGKPVPNVVLNYIDDPKGGSKNLHNMIDSLSLILEKHHQTLSPHVKHLYHQIIGVNWIRFRNFSEARKHLWKAVKYQPKKLATWGRLCIAFFPFLAKRFYSETVNHA